MINVETLFPSEEIHPFVIKDYGIAFLNGDRQEVLKKAQILRAAPELLELVSRFVSAEQERMQAEGKKIRALHEAEDLLKTMNTQEAEHE